MSIPNINLQRHEEKIDLPQITGQPNRRGGALAKLPDDLVLAIVENVAEMDGMVTTWAV